MNTARHFSRRPEINTRNRPTSKKIWRPEHRSFQRKYTGFLLAAVFGAVALFMAVASYQLYQNYDIFKQLAYNTQPELIMHLEREMTEFSLFVIATLASVFTFCLVLGLRMTSNIVRPLVHLERHMKKVTNGDWASPDFRFRDADDMSSTLNTYAYMYRSLRAHTESELRLLEKLSVDPKNRESVAIWNSLIQQKRAQLNLPGRLTAELDIAIHPVIDVDTYAPDAATSDPANGEATVTPPANRRVS